MPMATSNIESNTSPTFEVACALLCSRQGIHPAMVAGTRMVKSSVLKTGFMSANGFYRALIVEGRASCPSQWGGVVPRYFDGAGASRDGVGRARTRPSLHNRPGTAVFHGAHTDSLIYCPVM